VLEVAVIWELSVLLQLAAQGDGYCIYADVGPKDNTRCQTVSRRLFSVGDALEDCCSRVQQDFQCTSSNPACLEARRHFTSMSEA
jgi:hypothetical protein